MCLTSPPLEASTDGLSLAVGITHQLKLATDDEPVLKIQNFPPPDSLDILSSSSILIRLTGSFEGKQISAKTLQRSSLVAYLLEYLKFHAAKLFIGNISGPYVNADGTVELAIVSSRALLYPDELPVTTAILTALNWSFVWKSKSKEVMNPFSPQHLLPVQNVAGSLIEKVLSRDFVRRYPLIFGSWRNSLGAEMGVFPQVAQPILNIIARSQNPTFQKQCRGILRSLRRGNNNVYDDSLERVQGVFGSLILDGVPVLPHKNDKRTLLVSLQRLNRTLFRPERFKASTSITESDDPLYSSDHHMLSSDTLLEQGDSTPSGDPDPEDLPLDSDETTFMDLFTETPRDTGNKGTPSVGTLTPQEIPGVGPLFEANPGAFTLAGMDDGWESVDMQLNPTQRRDAPPLDDNDLGCVAPDPYALSTAFPWHLGTCSDILQFHDIGFVALGHDVLDLDSDDEEMGEELVLDFQEL